mgnify:CR=1 FL=1
MPVPRVTVSVVSHRQNTLVNGLLDDLGQSCGEDIAVVLTQNVPDPVPFAADKLAFSSEVIANGNPKGFGTNHNAAFARCRTPFFCVANPDIRLRSNPFPALLESLREDRVGAAGPAVRNPSGALEDSARRFPTAASLLQKLIVRSSGPDYPVDQGPIEVDWVAGMFMVFRSEVFRAVGGFDEAYFLYYEDVDLCRRLHATGKSVLYNPKAEVVHDARRASRRDLALMRHHAASMLRFLLR